ncbi:unnamed protein product [Ambrosiozyma monospora]|uniref:Unnamed protein product n=1 Tax=Ambrosiozyma monospora TaxID=43982 RepID=A0ACB5UD03_AMBMO|nr:unnamed protein product [Ambrosiozyma monospora]
MNLSTSWKDTSILGYMSDCEGACRIFATHLFGIYSPVTLNVHFETGYDTIYPNKKYIQDSGKSVEDLHKNPATSQLTAFFRFNKKRFNEDQNLQQLTQKYMNHSLSVEEFQDATSASNHDCPKILFYEQMPEYCTYNATKHEWTIKLLLL